MRKLGAIFIVLLATSAWGGELIIVAPDFWCPYSCKASDANRGFTIDIIDAIFSAHGDRVKFVNMNYARALSEVRSGEATATPATYKNEAPDFVFPDEPISSSRYCFYTAANSQWKYTGVESIATLRIGIIKGYSYGDALDRAIRSKHYDFETEYGDDLTIRMAKMMMAGRLDAFVEDEKLLAYLRKMNPELKLRKAGCEKASDTYMAISPKSPQAQRYAKIFSDGMKELKRSGELTRILERYGINKSEDN